MFAVSLWFVLGALGMLGAIAWAAELLTHRNKATRKALLGLVLLTAISALVIAASQTSVQVSLSAGKVEPQ